MNSKTIGMVFGGILIVIALIIGGLQLLHLYNFYNFFGGAQNRWYFYGSVGVIGLIGIALVAWSLLKEEAPKK